MAGSEARGMRVSFSADYVASAAVMHTTRKSGWIADSLIAAPIEGVTMHEPEPLTVEDMAAVHEREYVMAVKTGRPSGLASSGQPWTPTTFQAVASSSSGAVAAAMHALGSRRHAGSLSSGLHHARAGRGMGFCVINGLALAVRAVEEAGAVALVVDLDAHCGGGTVSLLRAHGMRSRHLDVSVCRFDDYQPSAEHQLVVVENADAYLTQVEARVDEELRRHAPDVILYNAGMDPYEEDGVGGLAGITDDVLAQREALVCALARAHGVPVAWVLAGGYCDKPHIVRLHRLTIAAFAGCPL